ncbi:MAG: rRNA maturation RNase YbeY [Actinomycetota bacterium]|nr:rRNA maturation RNase YbeY [Actinomycetota bacterium]
MDVLIENQSGIPVELSALKLLAKFVLGEEEAGRDSEVSIALVDKDAMKALNLKFRAFDKPTDVLAFDLGDDGELSGEVVISPQVAAEQAAETGTGEFEEVQRLLIHGLLHLLGYSHERDEDADKMFDKQEMLRQAFIDGGSV